MPMNASHPQPVRRWRKWLKRVGLVLGALVLIVVGTWLVCRIRYAQRANQELQEWLAELDAADPAWRLEDIEAAREAIPEEQNSARVVIAAKELLLAKRPGPPPEQANLPEHGELENRVLAIAPEVQLDAALTADLRKELNTVRPAVEKARLLVGMPKGRHRLVYAEDFLGTLLGDQASTRGIVRMLSLDAARLAQEGDPEKALASCHSAVNAARSLGDEPLLISVLLRTDCLRRAQRSLERTLAQGEPEDASLQALQAILEDEEKQPLLVNALRGERAAMPRVVDALESGADLDSPASLDAFTLFLLGPGFYTENRYWLSKLLTEAVEVARLPEDQQEKAFAAWDTRRRELRADHIPRGERWDAIIAFLVLPDLTRVDASYRRHLASLRCSIAALAAERHRLREGVWPDSLDALVNAKLLPRVPTDPYDARPLRFRRTEDGVMVYSVGPDHRDDGGALYRWHPTKSDPTEPGTDLGFQLWDPTQRRRME
jgi:hypothetical protein